MRTLGRLSVDPGSLERSDAASPLEIVVPYTEWSLTQAVLQRAAVLTAGLQVRILLIAVHNTPYPATIGCPAMVHAHLVEQLIDLAGSCPLAVNPQVVLARYWDEGFRYAIKPNSTVLIGTWDRLWRTHEERLAQLLAREGHEVALIHVEKG
jgi:hypothetical protein